jgi:hypothetical protein
MGCTTGKSEISNTTAITSDTKSRFSLEPIQPPTPVVVGDEAVTEHLASTAETDDVLYGSLYFIRLKTRVIF